jgi:hypothetical protein
MLYRHAYGQLFFIARCPCRLISPPLLPDVITPERHFRPPPPFRHYAFRADTATIFRPRSADFDITPLDARRLSRRSRLPR